MGERRGRNSRKENDDLFCYPLASKKDPHPRTTHILVIIAINHRDDKS